MNRSQARAVAELPLDEDMRWSVSKPSSMGCITVTAVRAGSPDRLPIWIGPDGYVWEELTYSGHQGHLRALVTVWLDLHYQGQLGREEMLERLQRHVAYSAQR